MRRNHIKNSFLHALTPKPQNQSLIKLEQYDVPELPAKIINSYHKNTSFNVNYQRSRKHRLIDERNTQIERDNRMLYQKIRKIKLKNSYQSQKNLQNIESLEQNNLFAQTRLKKFQLPKIDGCSQFQSTKSQLKSILSDRQTFIGKYFKQLEGLSKRGLKTTEQIGVYLSNGWKIHAMLIQNQCIVLVGRKGKKQLTKKYIYSRVRQKLSNNLEAWVNNDNMKFIGNLL